jgi:hypothetical protein
MILKLNLRISKKSITIYAMKYSILLIIQTKNNGIQ